MRREYAVFAALTGILLVGYLGYSSGYNSSTNGVVTAPEYGGTGQIAGNNPLEEPATASDSPDEVRIPLSEITGKVGKMSLIEGGTEINYIVVEGSDGKARTAFDACEVCGGGMGYSQKGGDVRCDKCGRFFRIDDLGTANRGGGCWPAYLEHEIDGDDLVIKKADIRTGKRFFQ